MSTSNEKDSQPSENNPFGNSNTSGNSENTSGNSDMSDTQKLTKEEPSSEPPEQSNQDPEAAEESKDDNEELSFTKEDLYDFNLDYIKSPRGILNICHIVFSVLVMSLIGSACHASVHGGSGWLCHQSNTFAFVIATSAFLQSSIFLACCLLTKKCDEKLLVTSYELAYHVTFALAFFIASLATVLSEHPKISASVFGFCAFIAYACSAGWFVFCHKIWQKIPTSNEGDQQSM